VHCSFPADHPSRALHILPFFGKEISRDLIGAYVTTKQFLLQFGFNSLRDLPDAEALEDAGRRALYRVDGWPAHRQVVFVLWRAIRTSGGPLGMLAFGRLAKQTHSTASARRSGIFAHRGLRFVE
jgi:hypothetical protein